MAHWLLQTNMNQRDFNQITDALDETNSPYSKVKLVPFTKNVQGLPHGYKDMPVALLGTVNFMEWGRKKGLPGVWWNDNFTFEVQLEKFGAHMLNADSIICPFGGIPKFEGERFIRPVDDGKAFTGEIIDWYKLVGWQDRIQYLSSEQLPPTLPVQVATVKRIFREYRFFVVNGTVVTGSMYNEDNKLIRKKLDDSDWNVVGYAQSMVNLWTPDTVFVIDIAVMEDTGDMKIIEINNANACGFYESDISAFIRAVNNIL